MTIGKKGFQPKNNNPSPKCPKRANGRPESPSLQFLGRKWRQMTSVEKSQLTWNNYVATMRKNKIG